MRHPVKHHHQSYLVNPLSSLQYCTIFGHFPFYSNFYFPAMRARNAFDPAVLRDQLVRLYASRIPHAEDAAAGASLRSLVAALRRATPPAAAAGPPASTTVSRAYSLSPCWKALGAALPEAAQAQGLLSFWQNPNYLRTQSQAWLDLYSSATICGHTPHALLQSREVLIGLILMGPGLLYPSHSHPALEHYLVLSGNSLWRRGEEPYREMRHGSWSFHHESEKHDFLVPEHSAPVLALWAWTGDTETHAEMEMESTSKSKL